VALLVGDSTGVWASGLEVGFAPEISKSSKPKLLLFKSISLDMVIDAFSVVNTQKYKALEKNKQKSSHFSM
jgi:hypothetical protein